MGGFLNIINQGDTLPFQNSNARFDWKDKMVCTNYLPTFFTEQFISGNDITEIIIYKLDINLVKKSKNYDELVAAQISNVILSDTDDYIEKVTKENGNIIYKSFFGKQFSTNLEGGLYYIEFTDGTKNLMSDVFCVNENIIAASWILSTGIWNAEGIWTNEGIWNTI